MANFEECVANRDFVGLSQPFFPVLPVSGINSMVIVNESASADSKNVMVVNNLNHLAVKAIPFVFMYSAEIFSTTSAINRMKNTTRKLIRFLESDFGRL